MLTVNGADVTISSDFDITPLHHAAWNSHTELVKLLLAQCPKNINARESEGQTPLARAKEFRNNPVIKFLQNQNAREIYEMDLMPR